jgi:hypothetical protein
MKHTIKIKELCQCNHISKEHAELIVKEIQNSFNNIHALIFEVVLSFKGITGISLEASTIIRNYIFDNKLEKSIYLINMTQYVRQVFFHNSKTSKETNENEMNNPKQKELSKFGKGFLNFMNNKGGVQTVVIFGLTTLAFVLGPFFVQSFNLLCSDMNGASKAIVIFCLAWVIIALVCLINVIILVNNKQNK